MGKIIACQISDEICKLIEKMVRKEFQTKSAIIRRLIVGGLRAEGFLREGMEGDKNEERT